MKSSLTPKMKKALVACLLYNKGRMYYNSLPVSQADHDNNRALFALEDRGIVHLVPRADGDGGHHLYLHELTAAGRTRALELVVERLKTLEAKEPS